jgi:hypothetical protein
VKVSVGGKEGIAAGASWLAWKVVGAGLGDSVRRAVAEREEITENNGRGISHFKVEMARQENFKHVRHFRFVGFEVRSSRSEL